MKYSLLKKSELLCKYFNMLSIDTQSEIILQQLNRDLYKKWTDIFKPNDDFSFYDFKEYLYETLICFDKYTYDNINKTFAYLNEIGFKPSSIVDFYGGVGITTEYIRHLFGCETFLYNTSETQRNANPDIQIINTLSNGSLFCAFDVFEHFKEPIKVLEGIIGNCEYEYMVFNNVFIYSDAIGHYSTYEHNNTLYNGHDMVNLFKNILIENGYGLVYEDGAELQIFKKL